MSRSAPSGAVERSPPSLTVLPAMRADSPRHESDDRVVARILRGELLTLQQAADVAKCSDEKIMRASKLELLDDLEQGKIDRRRGPDARQRAEARASKYEGWARPQEPLVTPERAAG